MRVSRFIALFSAFSLVSLAQNTPSGTAPADSSKLLRLASIPDSKILRKVPAMYPADAVAQHVQGVVKLSVIIGKNGKVEHIKLLSGSRLLAPAAMHAVEKWVFEPFGTIDQPARVITQIDVPFKLDSDGNPVTPK